MQLAALATRVLNAFRKRSGATVSWPNQSSPWNWWQQNTPVSQTDFGSFAPVYACWAIISGEVSRVPLRHVRRSEDGVLSDVQGKAPMRIFRTPNAYQTVSDVFLFLTQSLLAAGNAYWIAQRNDRNEVSAVYPINPRTISPFIASDGSVYYQVADSETIALGQVDLINGTWYPARDVLHIRLFTLSHPLKGVSPMTAFASGATAGMNINAQTAMFYGNMGRPSGVLEYPGKLDETATERIKNKFIDATTKANTGAPVVLPQGMKWTPLTMSAVDADLVKTYGLTERQVAQVYRVPMFLLGEEVKFSSSETQARVFVNQGLGFYMTHISNALTRFFDLPPNEEIVFDYETALLRGDLESRMKALKEGIQGGILSNDEARRREGLAPVPGGKEVRMQQQMVPLTYWENQPADPESEPVPPAEEPSPEEEELSYSAILRDLERRIAA